MPIPLIVSMFLTCIFSLCLMLCSHHIVQCLITAKLENTSQCQPNNAPGSRLIEGVGNITMVECDFSGVNQTQFHSISMTQESI